MNSELPDVQAGFRKGRGTSDQIANILVTVKAYQLLPTPFTSSQMAYKGQSNLFKHTVFKIWLFWLVFGAHTHTHAPPSCFPWSPFFRWNDPSFLFPQTFNHFVSVLWTLSNFPIYCTRCGNKNHTPFSNRIGALPNLGRLTYFFNQQSKPSLTGS